MVIWDCYPLGPTYLHRYLLPRMLTLCNCSDLIKIGQMVFKWCWKIEQKENKPQLPRWYYISILCNLLHCIKFIKISTNVLVLIIWYPVRAQQISTEGTFSVNTNKSLEHFFLNLNTCYLYYLSISLTIDYFISLVIYFIINLIDTI